MLIDPIDIDIDLLIFIQRHNIVINGQEPEYKREHNRQQTHNQ